MSALADATRATAPGTRSSGSASTTSSCCRSRTRRWPATGRRAAGHCARISSPERVGPRPGWPSRMTSWRDATSAERAGFEDIGRPIPMRRARPDGSEFAWQLLIPRGLAFRQPWPLLIEWTTSDAERLRLEPAGHHDNGVLGIRELSVVVPSVEEATTVYGTRLGVPLDAANRLGRPGRDRRPHPDRRPGAVPPRPERRRCHRAGVGAARAGPLRGRAVCQRPERDPTPAARPGDRAGRGCRWDARHRPGRGVRGAPALPGASDG